MFENPRRCRQARNFTTNVLKILDLNSSSEQIFSKNWRWVLLIYKNLESLPDSSSQIFAIDWCSFSLFDRNKTQPQAIKTRETTASLSLADSMDDYRNSPTIKFCADLFPAHRCPSAIKFQIRLECASVNRSNVFLISNAYFPANKMNWQ